jgi:regulator of RNase E activity RraB
MDSDAIRQALEGHRVRNVALLADLRSRNLDLGALYSTEHHFWSFSEEDARMLADALRSEGYWGVTIGPTQRTNDGAHFWSIEAAFTRTLADAASNEVTEALVRLAAAHGSDYDGWGVSI